MDLSPRKLLEPSSSALTPSGTNLLHRLEDSTPRGTHTAAAEYKAAAATPAGEDEAARKRRLATERQRLHRAREQVQHNHRRCTATAAPLLLHGHRCTAHRCTATAALLHCCCCCCRYSTASTSKWRQRQRISQRGQRFRQSAKPAEQRSSCGWRGALARLCCGMRWRRRAAQLRASLASGAACGTSGTAHAATRWFNRC